MAAFLGRAYERIGGDLSEALLDRLERLYGRVKARLAGHREGEHALHELELAPGDERARAALAARLAELARSDQAFAAALTQLVQQAQEAGGIDLRLTRINVRDAGIVAPQGEVRISGTYVAGRDLSIGQQQLPPQIPTTDRQSPCNSSRS